MSVRARMTSNGESAGRMGTEGDLYAMKVKTNTNHEKRSPERGVGWILSFEDV